MALFFVELVGSSDVARRMKRDRQTVGRLNRKNPTFPAPLAIINNDTPVWDWVEVDKWLRENGYPVYSKAS